jgi:prephenate dehydratase
MRATIVVVLAVVVVEGAVSPGAIGGGGVAALRRLRGGASAGDATAAATATTPASRWAASAAAAVPPGGSSFIGASGFRVAFQGERGAYSEKSVRELLGPHVVPVGKDSFEEAFQAVASREVDYALLPIENSLGGSIHTNYDLLLRYNLYIVAEHTLRVRHSLLGLPGTKKEDVKTVLSHPQALAQCDNYLRKLGVKQEPKYDTAGSAKFIKENGLKDCAAIASDLAAEIYGMDVLDANIEDDDVNFTRFILLSRQPVGALIPPDMPAKTTLVFLVESRPGALYRALACFALRDIDLMKCESRPTSVQLLNYLAFSDAPAAKSVASSRPAATTSPTKGRFRYCFYLDYAACELDPNAQAALFHLREQSGFVRVLGSYPCDSALVGPIRDSLNALNRDMSYERLENGAGDGDGSADGDGDGSAAGARKGDGGDGGDGGC